VSQVRTSRQISPLSLLKCGLTARKIAQIDHFWYKFASKGYTPLSDFLQNLAWGRVSQVCTLTPNFTAVALKMWAYSQQNRKNGNFWYIFSPKGNFYKIWRGEGLPCPHNRANCYFCGFKNMSLTLPKSPKIAIFGINLPIRKNPEGP